jgi:septal ring factor EnvC (AmiA/AmiB activator)
MTDLTAVIITAIVSPVMLKVLEYLFSKSSEQTRSVNQKIEGLEKRVDELKDKNFQQSLEIAVLRAQLLDRDRQMTDRDKLIAELKKEIEDLRDKQETQ